MHSRSQAGFSLLQLSIILTVGALIAAAMLPAGGNLDKERVTLERMKRIEQATQGFMVQNGRRPYPSDISAAYSANAYGTSLAVPTTYNTSPLDTAPITHFTTTRTVQTNVTATAGSTTISKATSWGATINKNWLVSRTGVLQNYSWIEAIPSTTTITLNKAASADSAASAGVEFAFRNPLVAGGVPTKTLGLPDEYGIDGYGRRFIYMVDSRITTAEGCATLQDRGERGALALSSTDTFSTGTYDHVMWTLLSYGKDGQGATPIQGGGTRLATGNTDASTLVNAFYTAGETVQFTNLGLVKKAATSTFDDIVWVSQPTKNKCSLAPNSYKDFRIDGKGSADADTSAAFGDINGDGYQDLVFGIAQQNKLRVIFGKKNGWPTPSTAFDTTDTTGLTSSNGFTIDRGSATMTSFGTRVAVGDVNGDGYDDIIAGGTPASVTTDPSYAVIFGGASWPAVYTIGTSTLPTTAVTIAGMPTGTTSHVTVGDMNADGMGDIALPYDTAGSFAQGLLYGKAAGWANFTMSAATLLGNATDGFSFDVGTPDATKGDVSYGSDANSQGFRMSAICNVDGDSYQDLIIPGAGSTYIQRVYVVRGDSHTNLTALDTAGVIDPSSAGIMLRFDASAAAAIPNYDIKAIACKDVNSDGKDDILFYLKNNTTNNNGAAIKEYIYTWFGRASGSLATLDMDTNYDIQFDLTTSAPTWQDSTSIPQFAFGDVNNDGRKDIILSRTGDDPEGRTSGTTFLVDESGVARGGAGLSYVLYQPATCPYTSGVTCWGGANSIEKTFFTDYTFDGTSGIKIAGAVASDAMAIEDATDMNKDGKDDLILRSGVNPTGGYFMFGKTTWPATYDLNCTRDTSGAHCSTQIGTR